MPSPKIEDNILNNTFTNSNQVFGFTNSRNPLNSKSVVGKAQSHNSPRGANDKDQGYANQSLNNPSLESVNYNGIKDNRIVLKALKAPKPN